MPMGIVSDKEFDSELDNCGSQKREESNSGPISITPAIIQDSPKKGRGEGSIEVPNGLRKLIGEESIINGRQSAIDLAANLGISPSSVSAYSQGAISTATYNDRPNLTQINQSKERVSKRARRKLLLALSHITDDKLKETKPIELASIARNMSAIVKDMEPERETVITDGKGGPTFIFYSPQFRKEESFDVINVKE